MRGRPELRGCRCRALTECTVSIRHVVIEDNARYEIVFHIQIQTVLGIGRAGDDRDFCLNALDDGFAVIVERCVSHGIEGLALDPALDGMRFDDIVKVLPARFVDHQHMAGQDRRAVDMKIPKTLGHQHPSTL